MASMSLYMRSLKHGFRPPRRPRPKLSYICMGRTGPDRNRADSTRFCEQCDSKQALRLSSQALGMVALTRA